MSVVGIIEARIFRFLSLEMAVKSVGFLTDLGDQVALEKGVEVLRVVALGTREHALVDELINRTALHDGGNKKVRPMSDVSKV
jgi:hypothetical protein